MLRHQRCTLLVYRFVAFRCGGRVPASSRSRTASWRPRSRCARRWGSKGPCHPTPRRSPPLHRFQCLNSANNSARASRWLNLAEVVRWLVTQSNAVGCIHENILRVFLRFRHCQHQGGGCGQVPQIGLMVEFGLPQDTALWWPQNAHLFG